MLIRKKYSVQHTATEYSNPTSHIGANGYSANVWTEKIALIGCGSHRQNHIQVDVSNAGYKNR